MNIRHKIFMHTYMLIKKIVPMNYMSDQFRKPSGLFGKFIISSFFKMGNISLNKFMMQVVPPSAGDKVLDIGFGVGLMFEELINKVEKGEVHGIDFSKDMVRKCKNTFSKYINKKQLTLHEASIANIPYEDEYFNIIYTCNTLYFWQNPLSDAQEILRVIKPGGKLVVGFRSDVEFENIDVDRNIFTLYSKEELNKLLIQAGFSTVDIRTNEEPGMNSYAAIATKK